jgi:hypothetical protein
MASSKRRVVRYYGPGDLERGDIKYYDGDNWVTLKIGDPGEILITNGPGFPPSWEPYSQSSSSSSSSNIMSSSSSSGLGPIIEVEEDSEPVAPEIAQGMGDVHLMLGGVEGPIITYERSGSSHANVEYPFTASWNHDDNSSADEIVYIAIENPLKNKLTVITYTQKTGNFPAYGLENFHIYSTELNQSSSSYTPTGSISYSNSGGATVTISGNGECDFRFNSDTNTELTIEGSYWDGSQRQTVTESTLSAGVLATIDLGDIRLELSGDNRELTYQFWAMKCKLPEGTVWHQVVNNGGRIGGLYFDILNRCRIYRDGNVSLDGYPALVSIYGSPSSSSSHIAVLGNWGWYGNEEHTGSAHFIPLNFDSMTSDIDINNFVERSGRTYYDPDNLSTILEYHSVAVINAIAATYNELIDNTGYWTLGWFDGIFRQGGSFPSSSSAGPQPVPASCPDPCTEYDVPYTGSDCEDCLGQIGGGAGPSYCPTECAAIGKSVCPGSNVWCDDSAAPPAWCGCCCTD